MFRFNGFTEKANSALNLGIQSAQAMGHDYIGSEHIVLGLLQEGSGVAYTILSKLGVSAEAYEKLLRERIGAGPEPTTLTPDRFTPRTKQFLQIAAMARARFHSAYVGTEHILVAIAQDESCYAMRFLKILGVDSAVRPGFDPAGRPGENRPGHWPGRGDSAGNPNPLPQDEK